MRHVFTLLMIVLSMHLHAQHNLVPNGGFEEVINCPNFNGNLMTPYVQYWADPNLASCDYFNSCGSEDHQIPPSVVFGYQYPYSGEAFIGMFCFLYNQPELRDYAQTQLSEPIHAGVRYKVSFYVSLAELSRYAISSLGAHLSVQPLNQNDFWVIDVEPQIQNPAGDIIADTSGWVLITDTFASRTGGGEEWLTIGNFNYAADSDTFAFQPPNPDMGGSFRSYYYIDDVSVVALDSVPDDVGITEQQTLGFEVYPNPATDVVRFRVLDPSHSTGSGQAAALRVTVRVLDAVGKEVTPSSASGGHSPLQGGEPLRLNVSGLSKGVYFLELTNQEGERAVKKFVKE